MTGLKRNIEEKIIKLLDIFPVVIILGARQVGKTFLSKRIAPTWQYYDLEKPEDFEAIFRNPTFFFQQYPKELIIDEAQTYPEIFQILRGVVDAQPDLNGRFILTGSSSPELLKHTAETLAGRAALIELGTLKANEYYQQPLSDFYNIFLSKITPEKYLFKTPPLTALEMSKVWFRGGYPKPLLKMEGNDYQLWMESYRDSYINRDIARLFPRLNKIAYQKFLSILSKLSSTIINKSDLARALQVSEPTVTEYLGIIENTYLWRTLPSYEKNIIKSVIKMPKGYIRDSGLLHFLSRIPSMDDLINDYLLGASFEAFVIEEIIKGLQATLLTNWDCFYYRTRNGAEIDLILEGSFGTLPIEIKFSNTIKLKQIRSLIQFVDERNLPLGIVINQSDRVEWITEKIIQLPVGYI